MTIDRADRVDLYNFDTRSTNYHPLPIDGMTTIEKGKIVIKKKKKRVVDLCWPLSQCYRYGG